MVNKVFKDCNYSIALCADDNYMPLTAVAISSIIENSCQNNLYDILIVHDGVREYHTDSFLQMAEGKENISIRFFDISDMVENMEFYTANRKGFSKSAYYRLFLPWILEDGYEKVLYIDGDMVVTKDLYELINTDIADYKVAAVKDYWGICSYFMSNDTFLEYRKEIGIENVYEYVISSTLLFNLEKFRSDFTLDYIKDICTSTNWKQHDQDVINVLCQNEIYFLNPTWGFMSDWGNNHYLPRELLDELSTVTEIPAIVHYGAKRKPYITNYTDYDMLFWKHAYNTRYFQYFFKKIKTYEYRTYVANMLPEADLNFYYDNGDLYRSFEQINIGSLSGDYCSYRIIKVNNDVLHLEGVARFYGVSVDKKIDIKLRLNGKMYAPTEQLQENIIHKKRDDVICRAESFKFDIPLKDHTIFYADIHCSIDGCEFRKSNIKFERFAPISDNYKYSYYHSDGWAVVKNKSYRIKIYKCDDNEVKVLEKKFLDELKKVGGKREQKAVYARKLIRFLKRFVKKPIWIVADRVSKADDNGEAFFKYLNSEKSNEVDSYFVISKNCADYERLKSIGNVVDIYSWKHKILHLLSECVISSQTDEAFKNPFRGSDQPYKDILSDIRFIFLQHGVIVTELSDWLCREKQNIAGFVTTTKDEYNSIINGKYNYKDEVWLTGLPRFDYLENDPKKIITFLPTWRRYLTNYQDQSTGIWKLKEDFKNSEYVQFYTKLLSNEHLLSKAKELGYTIQFKTHPSFQDYEDKWDFGESIKLVGQNTSYRTIYRESDLIITDYSSSINDFIYLRKPIIYTQFDYDTFFSGRHNIKEGFLNYEIDGFGEVEYTLESTVARIIEYMENDCKLKDRYRKRIDNFFVFSDKSNCQRIYEKIMGADN